jgi:hypothetical protein
MYSINYIAAFNIGPNRPGPYVEAFQTDPLCFIRIHRDFLNTCIGRNITMGTFVVNDDIDDHIKQQILDCAQECSVPITVVFRENGGYSYGAWNDVIKNTINDYDYFFMIEDDYIPDASDFYIPFVDRIDETTPYVCGYVGVDMGIVHAAHSNGIIAQQACKKVLETNQELFVVNPTPTLEHAWDCQRNFLNHFTNLGYKITDITDNHLTRHMMDCYNIRISEFGNPNGRCLLQPIIVKRG